MSLNFCSYSFSYGNNRAKRFPLKLESKTSMINNGSKILYIYLETSWEKESWCKALRLASCDKKERVDWFFKLHEGFHNYLTTLNPGYPSFMKPSMGLCAEPADQMNRSDGTSSKVRFLWKKIAKKTSRVGLENRSSWAQLSGLAERKPTEKTRIFQELVSASASMKRSKSEENLVQQSPSTLSHSGSQSHSSGISDVDSDDRLGNDEGTLFFSKKNDEGTLCWNLFISRLFFDVKSNAEIKRSIQAWVQVYSLLCIRFCFIFLCAQVQHMLLWGKVEMVLFYCSSYSQFGTYKLVL